MKKYLGLLLCLLVINACDDGDMKIDTFDFSATQSKFCATNKLLYKVSGNEALILQINNAADAFPYRNVLGVRNIAINQSNRIIYRTFDSDVPESYFCSTIPPVSPTVTTEYITPEQSNGTIEITTTLVPGTTTIATATYLHSIVLRNVTLTNAQGQTIIYEALNFGTYQTSSNVDLAFGSQPRQMCGTNSDVYFKIIDSNVANNATEENLNKIIELTIPSALLPELVDDPTPIFINQAQGVKAKYRIYNGDVTGAEYCAQSQTLVDRLYEEWIAEDGVDEPDSSTTLDRGYFVVTKNQSNNTVSYSISLNTVKFNRSYPVDPQGGIIGSFTTSASQNF